MTFKEDWNNWSKGDKLGNIIYSVLILTLCGGIVYLFGFKDHLIIISDLLQKNLGEFIGVIYFLILGVGIMVCGGLITRIIEKLFYPDNKDEKEVKELKNKLRKKYSIRLVNLKVKELKTKQKLKQYKEEIGEY